MQPTLLLVNVDAKRMFKAHNVTHANQGLAFLLRPLCSYTFLTGSSTSLPVTLMAASRALVLPLAALPVRFSRLLWLPLIFASFL
jgi:hypothetical protein